MSCSNTEGICGQNRRFRADLSRDSRSRLFLSWIGQHTPVPSSTIARWLKSLMVEAGIDILIFKEHSVRGASCSTTAGVGVTTKRYSRCGRLVLRGHISKVLLQRT